MSSDVDYEKFLAKSQTDYSGGQSAESQSKSDVVSLESVHPKLKTLEDRFYTSDVDEPFEGVSYEWGKSSPPSTDEFGILIGAQSDKIELLDPKQWDTRGVYKDVTDTVAAATDGSVSVYRVEGTGARVEYFVLGLGQGKVLGVKVKAVES